MSINTIVDIASAGYYAASVVYQPLAVLSNANHLLDAHAAKDHEKKLEHAVKLTNTSLWVTYNTSLCGISIATINATQLVALEILKVASFVTGIVGFITCAIASIPETLGLARSLRLEKHVDVLHPEETLAWVKEHYLSDPVGKAKLERRIGKWLVEEIETELKTSDTTAKPALSPERAKELVELVAAQNKKKMTIQGLALLALVVSAVAIFVLGLGVSFVYLLPIYAIFTALLVAKHVIDNGVFNHKGWDVDKSSLVPEWIKTQAARLRRFLSEGCSVATNAASEENVCPLKVKSSS